MTPPFKDRHTLLHKIDLGGYRFPARSDDRRSTRAPLRFRTPDIMRVVVIEAAGRLEDFVEELDRAIQLALATVPRGVVCDLTAVLEDVEPGALEVLAAAGRHVRDWPAIPVAVASPDPRVREALNVNRLGGQLIVTNSQLSALYEVLRTHTSAVRRLLLSAHPSAPGAARAFVTSNLLEWQLATVAPWACLVASELVTNATLHAEAGSDIHLSLERNPRSVRLTVRDTSPAPPRWQPPGLGPHGRGLVIVAGLSRDFGVLPTTDGGKVVWAVLDAPQTDPSIAANVAEPAVTRATPVTVLVIVEDDPDLQFLSRQPSPRTSDSP